MGPQQVFQFNLKHKDTRGTQVKFTENSVTLKLLSLVIDKRPHQKN